MPAKKPPVGIMPESMHDHIRARELAQAIVRYLDDGQWPPEEWAAELCQLNNDYAPARLEIRAGAINHA